MMWTFGENLKWKHWNSMKVLYTTWLQSRFSFILSCSPFRGAQFFCKICKMDASQPIWRSGFCPKHLWWKDCRDQKSNHQVHRPNYCHLAAAVFSVTLHIVLWRLHIILFFLECTLFLPQCRAKQPQLIGDSVLQVSVHGHLSQGPLTANPLEVLLLHRFLDKIMNQTPKMSKTIYS